MVTLALGEGVVPACARPSALPPVVHYLVLLHVEMDALRTGRLEAHTPVPDESGCLVPSGNGTHGLRRPRITFIIMVSFAPTAPRSVGGVRDAHDSQSPGPTIQIPYR